MSRPFGQYLSMGIRLENAETRLANARQRLEFAKQQVNTGAGHHMLEAIEQMHVAISELTQGLKDQEAHK